MVTKIQHILLDYSSKLFWFQSNVLIDLLSYNSRRNVEYLKTNLTHLNFHLKFSFVSPFSYFKGLIKKEGLISIVLI